MLGPDAEGLVCIKSRQRTALYQSHWWCADKFCNKGIAWGIIQLLWRAALLDTSIFHQNNCICHAHGFCLVMGDIHHRHAKLFLQFFDVFADGMAQFGVKVRQWLIHQAQRLPGHDRPRQSHALALTARKRRWFAVCIVAQTCDLECPI